jgi:hypothetical protein
LYDLAARGTGGCPHAHFKVRCTKESPE